MAGAASLAISLAVFAWIFERTSLDEIGRLARNVDRGLLGWFITTSLTTNVLRAWRYKLLLRGAGYRVSPLRLYLIVFVRNFCSDILPARLGGLAFIALATTRLGVSVAAATAAAALEIVLDVLALSLLLLACASVAVSGAALPLHYVVAAAVILAGGSWTGLRLLPRVLSSGARMFARRRDWPATARALDEMSRSVESVRAQRNFRPLLLLSLGIRAGKYAGLYLFLLALLVPEGQSSVTLPFTTIVFGLCAAEFAATLPLSGLGGFGLYEGAWTYAFTLIGLEESVAAASGVAHHLLTQAFGIVTAGAALLTLILLPKPPRQ